MPFRDDMEALLAAYLAAYTSRDAAKCAALFAEGATIYSPFGPPVSGHHAIEKAHEDWFALDESDKRLDLIDCAASEYVGWCLIAFSADLPDGSHEAGTNLCAMVRRAGTWQIRYSSMTEAQPG